MLDFATARADEQIPMDGALGQSDESVAHGDPPIEFGLAAHCRFTTCTPLPGPAFPDSRQTT